MANNTNRQEPTTPLKAVTFERTFTDDLVTIAAARLTRQSWPDNDKAVEAFVRDTKRIVQQLRAATDD